jgi:SpoVK/Ycf46/Vps4 family AAA+-type ATPase
VQVRSSKQDQIHNSIVSTLLALMDGLDARGQVGDRRLPSRQAGGKSAGE